MSVNTIDLLSAALSALRSYQYGNESPDLAKRIADKIDEALKAATDPEAAPKIQRIGMVWIHNDGAVWEFNADKDREETLGMKHVPVYVDAKEIKR